jgi:hypothetical protein
MAGHSTRPPKNAGYEPTEESTMVEKFIKLIYGFSGSSPKVVGEMLT